MTIQSLILTTIIITSGLLALYSTQRQVNNQELQLNEPQLNDLLIDLNDNDILRIDEIINKKFQVFEQRLFSHQRLNQIKMQSLEKTEISMNQELDKLDKISKLEKKLVTKVQKQIYSLKNDNQWEPYPGMSVDISITKQQTVKIFYNILNYQEKAGEWGSDYLVTTLKIDDKELESGRSITSNSKFYQNTISLDILLEEGSHRIQVYYRTPMLIVNQWQHDWNTAVLQATYVE